MQSVPANSAPAPESQFHQTVEAVQQKGDIFDRLTWLRRNSFIGGTALTGTCVASFDAFAGTTPISFTSGGLVLAGSLIASTAARPFAERSQRKKAAPLLESYAAIQSDFNGDSVEIYRTQTKAKTLHVLWEARPNITREDVPDALAQLDKEVQRTDIKTVTISSAAVAEFDIEKPTPIDRFDWMKQIKRKTPVEDVYNEEDAVLKFTAAEFSNFVSALHEHEQRPLDIYMNLLKQHAKRHPSLAYYGNGMAKSASDRQRLARSLAARLNAKLQDIDVQPVHDDYGQYRGKEKVNKIGRIGIPKGGKPRIEWSLSTGRPLGETESLLAFFGLDETKLADLPEAAKTMRRDQLITACELGAYLSLADALHKKPKLTTAIQRGDQGVQANQANGEHVRGMQVRTVDRLAIRRKARPIDAQELTGVSLQPLGRRRLGRTALAIVAAGTAGFGLYNGAYTYYDNYFEKHISGLYDKMSAAKYGSSDYKHYEAMIAAAGKSDPLYTAIDAVSNVQGEVRAAIDEQFTELAEYRDLVPSELEEIAEDQYEDRNISLVGDVPNGKNKPRWFMQSYGGMSSEGYWSESSYHNVDFDSGIMWYGHEAQMDHWDTNSRETGKRVAAALPLLPMPDNVDRTQPHVKIERLLSSDVGDALDDKNVRAAARAGYGFLGDYTAINVPVLKDTHIVAGSYKGKAIKVYRQKDNQQVILVPKQRGRSGESGKMEYWLAPHARDSIRAMEPIDDLGTYDSDVMPALTAGWQQTLPQSLHKQGLARADMQAAFLRNTFQYALQPLKKSPSGNLAEYAQQVLISRVANCNTANTLLAVSNPTVLNPISGYHNTDTPAQKKANRRHLSSNEAHLWTADKDGSIHDATPGPATGKDAEHFKEDYASEFSDPAAQRALYLKLAGGLLLLGVAGRTGYRSRHRAQAAAIHIARAQAAKTIAAASDQQMLQASEIINHIGYAPGRLDHTALTRIRERVSTPQAYTLESRDGLQQLTFASRSNEQGRKLKKVARRKTDTGNPAVRQATKDALRLARAARLMRK
jgi:hypothetical protein